MALTDQEILDKVIQFRADGVYGSSNFFDRMRKAEDFVIGEQWEPAIKEAARLKGKFTLTIPIVKPQIKQLAGSEIQNPQDFIIENTQGGAAAVARILTALTKQAADSERIRYEKSQTFESGVSSGQGAIGVFIDRTEDPKHANLRIEKLNEHNTLVDPNTTSYNPNKLKTGAKYVVWEEWVDKEFVEIEYPDKKTELEARGSQSFLEVVAGNISGIVDWMTGRKSSRETSSFSSTERTDIEVMTKSRYLKSHTWWREPKKCVHWYDNRKSEIDSMFLHKDSDIAAAKKATKANPDIFSIEEVNCNIMHHTIRVKDTFLEDRVDELNGVQMFPVCFFWPYWINGYKSGVSEDLIGTQEEINWTHSMALNLIKQVSNSGYRIKSDEAGDFSDWLKTHGGEDGIVLDESKGGGKVEKLEGPNLAHAQYEAFTQQALNNARTITGIRTEIPEKDTKALSGRAIFLKKQSETQGSLSILNNWFYTLAIMGDLVVDIIRKNDIFSEDEIREIVDREDLLDETIMDQAKGMIINLIQQRGERIPQQPKPLNPIRMRNGPRDPNEAQKFMELQAQILDLYIGEVEDYKQFIEKIEQDAKPIAEDILIRLIHSMKSGKYNTKVTVSPMSETMRAIKATEIFELQKVLIDAGDVGLDGENLIDATDVPNKEELKQGRKKKLESLARSA